MLPGYQREEPNHSAICLPTSSVAELCAVGVPDFGTTGRHCLSHCRQSQNRSCLRVCVFVFICLYVCICIYRFSRVTASHSRGASNGENPAKIAVQKLGPEIQKHAWRYHVATRATCHVLAHTVPYAARSRNISNGAIPVPIGLPVQK